MTATAAINMRINITQSFFFSKNYSKKRDRCYLNINLRVLCVFTQCLSYNFYIITKHIKILEEDSSRVKKICSMFSKSRMLGFFYSISVEIRVRKNATEKKYMGI